MDAASLAATCRAAAAFHRSVRVIDECAASLVKFAHRVDAGLGRDWFAGTVHWDEASYALFWSLATRDVALSLGQAGEPRPIRIEKYKWFVNETPAADPRAFLATPVLMQYGHLHSTWLFLNSVWASERSSVFQASKRTEGAVLLEHEHVALLLHPGQPDAAERAPRVLLARMPSEWTI